MVSSAWLQGHRGGAPSSCEQRPVATRKPRCAASVGDLVDQAGLPDPGLTDEQGARRVAGIRTFERLHQVGLLAVAADGRPADGLVPRGPGPGGHGTCRRGPVRRRGHRKRCGRSHHGRPQPLLQGGVLDEHGLLEVAQLLPGIEPELVGQQAADVPQRRECLGLASGPRQRQGVQGPDTFLQRIPGRGLLGGGDDHRVVAEREQAEHAVLLRVHAELPERRSLEGHLGLVGEVGVRLAGPEREQLLEPVHLRGDLGVAGPLGRGAGAELAGERRQGAVPAAHLVGEVVGVDLVAAQLEPVAVVPGEEHARSLAWAEAGFEHAAYAGEVGVQRAVRTAGRVRAPDQIDQHVRRYVAAQPERQRRQYRPWLAGAELEGSVVLPEHHLTRTEDAHPHAETVTGPRPKWP